MTNYDKKYDANDKYSLRGRVFQKLREDILSGKYKEHEELKEVAIGEELGVSRTPVREAFRQLELEGLIRIVPNKGAYVTGITAKDVKDIYMIRSLLEGLCARLATEKIQKNRWRRWRKTFIWRISTRRRGIWIRSRSWTTVFTIFSTRHAIPSCWSIPCGISTAMCFASDKNACYQHEGTCLQR